MRSRIAFVIALPIISACSAVAGKPSDSAAATASATNDPAVVRKNIDEANAKFAAAMVAGDAAGVSANYADNATTLWPNSPPISSRPAIAAALTEQFKAVKFSSMTVTTSDVILAGDLAVETGTFTATLTPTGMKLMSDTAKYITVWQKQGDGSWKIVRDSYSTNLPAPH